MRTLPALVFLTAFSIATAADEVPKTGAPAAKESLDWTQASTAKLTAPVALKDGAISQPSQTELDGGGKAVFTVRVPKDGEYVIRALVNAPEEDANSFFVNIDAAPEDPVMIWDVEVTKGFEERVVSWRGNGDPNNDEFIPKVFKLTAGEHKVIVVGREPTQLKAIALKAK